MAAGITNNRQMAFTGATPWHGMGTVIGPEFAYNAAEWMRQGGCDFNVEKRAVFQQLPDGTFVASDKGNMFVRSDNNAVLGIVGPDTHVLQNSAMFDCIQTILDSRLGTMETCGALWGGSRVWGLVKIAGGTRDVVPGDAMEQYLLFSNPHDGMGAIAAGLTMIRVVCANTDRAARRQDAKTLMKITHSANVLDKTVNATLAMKEILEKGDDTIEQFRLLAGRRNITSAKLKEYITAVFDMKAAPRKGSNVAKLSKQAETKLEDILRIHDRNTGIVNDMIRDMKERDALEKETHSVLGVNLIDAVLANMEAGKGTDIAGARNSWWSAYNAVTEYLTHHQGHSAETRLASGAFGPNAILTEKALDTALEMSA